MSTHKEVTLLSESLGRRTSVPDQVAQMVRQLILSGKFATGQRVVETRFARQLGVGQPTVREALRMLAGEGLVFHRPNRGYCVTALSSQQVDQIFRLRTEWEPLAAELAVENRPHWSSKDIEKIFKRFERAARKGDVEEFYQQDLEFHRELWRLSGNPYLVQALLQIVMPYFAFCMVRHLSRLKLDLDANGAKHGEVLQAVLHGSKEHARRVTRETIESFGRNAMQLLAENAEQSA